MRLMNAKIANDGCTSTPTFVLQNQKNISTHSPPNTKQNPPIGSSATDNSMLSHSDLHTHPPTARSAPRTPQKNNAELTPICSRMHINIICSRVILRITPNIRTPLPLIHPHMVDQKLRREHYARRINLPVLCNKLHSFTYSFIQAETTYQISTSAPPGSIVALLQSPTPGQAQQLQHPSARSAARPSAT